MPSIRRFSRNPIALFVFIVILVFVLIWVIQELDTASLYSPQTVIHAADYIDRCNNTFDLEEDYEKNYECNQLVQSFSSCGTGASTMEEFMACQSDFKDNFCRFQFDLGSPEYQECIK